MQAAVKGMSYFCGNSNAAFLLMILLITPPFTQLNTPYPATAYLKGFFNTKNIPAQQCDLGIETTLAVFCKQGLTDIFNAIAAQDDNLSANAKRMVALKQAYINTIDTTIHFLQGKNANLAQRICLRNYLPEASRFANVADMEWALGKMGTQDKAKHLATLFLEDIADLIKECVDPYFGFSRYAERLGRSAATFDELYMELHAATPYISNIYLKLLHQKLEEVQPHLVCFSVPFPGNLFSAFKCAQYIKQHFPGTKIAMGGGFANTELRSLSDARVFEFFDFITLDDGEAPLENLYNYVKGQADVTQLKRTFLLQDGAVVYLDNTSCADYKQGQVGTPDYTGLPFSDYISAIEVANPMHKMWSDGQWNKLTMAHGCYWGKCTFCDTSLDYIQRYEPLTAGILADRMQELIEQNGITGFHFVDEAAPPALMRSLAIEIIRRGMQVSWWTNVRFEKNFTRDLCQLLKASGCIAVSGGLEVASDRLLALIDKGITVAQVANVTKHFTDAGIMVHAYLMYGFPTQTAQETIDSLEMVRQMFELGIIQSAFWHRFALTAHSPVGLMPAKYGVKREMAVGTFANNDVVYVEENDEDHDRFGFGLKKSLFNYMHHIGFDEPLHKWFEEKIPRTGIDKNYIAQSIEDDGTTDVVWHKKVIYQGVLPTLRVETQSKKGRSREVGMLSFDTLNAVQQFTLPAAEANWLVSLLPLIDISNFKQLSLADVKQNFEAEGLEDFELFWFNKPMNNIFKTGLWVV